MKATPIVDKKCSSVSKFRTTARIFTLVRLFYGVVYRGVRLLEYLPAKVAHRAAHTECTIECFQFYASVLRYDEVGRAVQTERHACTQRRN